MNTNRAVMIMGRISSGKSSLAKHVMQNIPNAVNISFGGFLKNYCLVAGINIEENRDVLQNIGQKFIEENPEKFLKDVVDYYSEVDGELHVFEGVRHEIIFEEIKRKYTNPHSIFLDVPVEIRYEWYSFREKEIDSKLSYEDFLKKDNHRVELEIDGLKQKCGLVVCPNIEDNYIQKVHDYLKL